MNFVELFTLLEDRKRTLPEGSGTTKLLQKGLAGILPKLNEESFEIGLALEHESDDAVALEVSQCFYYCILLAVHHGYSVDELKLDPSSASDHTEAHDLAKQIARKSALLCHCPESGPINDLLPLLFNALNLRGVTLEQMFLKL